MNAKLIAIAHAFFPGLTGYDVLVAREYLFVLPVVLLAILPGLGFAGLAARRVRFTWPETILLAFAFSLSWVSVTATLAHFLHLPFVVVWVLFLALIPASIGMFVYEWRKGHLEKPLLEWQGLAVATVGMVAAGMQRPWFWGGSDTFYHIAASRSLLATGRPLVADPFLGTSTRVLDPTSGIWHTYQALISKTLGQDLAVLYLSFTALAAALVLLGFWALARRISDSAFAATAASVAYAVGAWAFDFRAMAYPKHFSLALAFLGLLIFVRIMDKPRKLLVGIAVIVGYAAATMHLGSAQLTMIVLPVLLAVMLVLWGLLKTVGQDWGKKPLLALGATFGLIVLVSIPVLMVKTGALSGSQVVAPTGGMGRSVTWIGGQLPLLKPGDMRSIDWWVFWPGMAVIGFMIPQAFGRRDPHALAAFGLVAMPYVLLVNPLLTPIAMFKSAYILGRVAELLRFVPFIGMAWAIGRLRVDRKAVAGWLGVVLALVAVAGGIPYMMWTFIGEGIGLPRAGYLFSVHTSQKQDLRRSWGEKPINEMVRAMDGEYPVVAATIPTGYYLIGFMPVALMAAPPSHSPAVVETATGPERRRAVAEFFDPLASEEKRREIAKKWNVRYVILRDTSDELLAAQSMLAQPGLFTMKVDTPRLDMLEITP